MYLTIKKTNNGGWIIEDIKGNAYVFTNDEEMLKQLAIFLNINIGQ